MSKPILFVLYISLASIIGFIGGVWFGGSYKQNVALDTVSQHNEVEKLMGWYQLVVGAQIDIEALEKIESMSDVKDIIIKRKNNAISHVKLFREQARRLKKDAPNPEAILELESSVNEIAQEHFGEKP